MKDLQIDTYFDTHEFGFCFKFSRLKYHPDYLYQFDFHLFFLSIWINFKSKK